MELRRTCKYNYAAWTSYVRCYSIYMQVISIRKINIQKFCLDIFALSGIYYLTYNAVVKEVVMAKKNQGNDAKEKALRDCGAFNTHPVSDALFSNSDFFDSRDLVQVKYEMLRRVHKEGEPVARAAASFGFSRPSFYKSLREFEREGIPGLLPRKRGPRSRHKLTDDVLAFIEGFCSGEKPPGICALLDEVEKHFGIRVHRRTLERALKQPGKKMLLVPKKKQDKMP